MIFGKKWSYFPVTFLFFQPEFLLTFPPSYLTLLLPLFNYLRKELYHRRWSEVVYPIDTPPESLTWKVLYKIRKDFWKGIRSRPLSFQSPPPLTSTCAGAVPVFNKNPRDGLEFFIKEGKVRASVATFCILCVFFSSSHVLSSLIATFPSPSLLRSLTLTLGKTWQRRYRPIFAHSARTQQSQSRPSINITVCILVISVYFCLSISIFLFLFSDIY